ncbi:MAG: ATP-binding protein, partial [Clostridia bacterium]|nr:ATP-binding protein [Clostridia bacterium]
YAIDRGFVTADCDLSPERKLVGSSGSGLNTYRELVRNLSCKSSPDGGALPSIIGRWYTSVAASLAEEGITPGSPSFGAEVSRRIIREARIFESNVGGFDFALVVSEYCRAWGEGNDRMMSACLKWLRGEYNTKTEAREALGIRSVSVIDDSNWYDHVKLLAALVRKIGYSGLCIFIDECVNLYKIVNRVSRESNYEKILSMFNDTMQGGAEGLMIVFGGTPQFLEDNRRGLFSYEALRSRLADPRIVPEGMQSAMGPIIRLRRLGDSELLALIMRLTTLHGMYYGWEPRITDGEKKDFLTVLLDRTGADSMITPREIIRDYIGVLDLLYQNPDAAASELFPAVGQNDATDREPTPSNRKITVDDIEF